MRVAVVGAGRWGRLHLLKWRRVPGARVVAVVDRQRRRAEDAAAEAPGARVCERVADLPHGIEVASVAVDLPNLADVAEALLLRGVHVLVEKPLACSPERAAGLVRLAARADRVLAVGFLERFNPGVPTTGSARRFVARRVGPPSRCVGPLDLDWLVHDLDLASHLLGPGLEVVGARWGDDDVRVRLMASDGREAAVLASRRAGVARRRLWLDGRRADLLATQGDPLGVQISAFADAARGEAAPSLARGEDAVVALALLDAARALRPAVAA